MNRFASGLLAAAFLVGGAGLAFAAGAPTSNGERMTAALNALKANGYGDFSSFHADGQNFAATVNQNNQKVNVVVNPDTGQITRQG